ncbi:tetratricopeptide repeat domain 12 [Homo sapiens]|uniref:Tetratricopeptide repeat protein 12 n=1 Tax=Homo sapiens TaxID=9606 RepID=J3KR69_HUMAN|nr:tetratricopeptide repeat protein 12 isoform 1 [Homo sapiens]EAW67213.1 tetratricopeptide repeat domain 12, isoform CRA_d [Homo sapiens]KAI2562850.1 tetratricopeptide repeat domain 12 [Homo sapiens]KAI4074187.1 tetratricopeptide repeat domain 12 [Homo sapiens]|eukprot:NP_001305462.1 tetratricopeptide repeat protein 12 isoform 1 [Homo sapiens]
MDADKEKDLQKFLKNVDEISNLIQEMNSDDPVVQQKAVLETEKRLLLMEEDQEEDECRTTLNKTMISPPQTAMKSAEEINSEAFLASVEKDAKERAKRRRENKVLADALKEKGNEAFAEGNYETAILRYSEGLEKLKDMKVLYTNRAQAYMKLEDYEKALVDCEWALKSFSFMQCDEKCTKAYFHMGKANLALKNYSVSRECYKKILEINPKLQTQVKGYLNQVDLQEKADLQEKEAHELLDSGKNTAVTTKNLLETLSKPDQIPLFYAGGIEILTEMINECTEQTLFRMHNGFSIISDNEVIRRCFSTAGNDAVEEMVCVSVLKLWQAVCSRNEENQRVLVIHHDRARLLAALLSSKVLAIRQQSFALLLHLAQTESGRSLIINHLDLTRLLEALVSFLDFSDKEANTAMGLFTDLALEERFQVWFQANLPGVLPALTGVLKTDPKVSSSSALCQCIAIMGNLSAEPTTRRHMAACEEFGDGCLSLLARCEEDVDLFREVIYTLLGLMMNLCLQAPFVSEVWAVEVSRRCLSLLNSQDGGILTRAAGVLSRTLSSSLKIVEEALRAGVVKKMMKFLKTGGETASRYAIKILAICTNSYHEAREEVIRLDKKLSVMMKLLSSEDEVLVGNAALCLGNCMEVPNVASSLLKTDLLQVLLKLAGSDTQKTAVQVNAGIALGKLCTAEPRFAAQLRKLHGLEILNSTMKYISDS